MHVPPRVPRAFPGSSPIAFPPSYQLSYPCVSRLWAAERRAYADRLAAEQKAAQDNEGLAAEIAEKDSQVGVAAWTRAMYGSALAQNAEETMKTCLTYPHRVAHAPGSRFSCPPDQRRARAHLWAQGCGAAGRRGSAAAPGGYDLAVGCAQCNIIEYICVSCACGYFGEECRLLLGA
jgi:hypothetical protein